MTTTNMTVETDPQVAGVKLWFAENGVEISAPLPGMPDEWFAKKYPALSEIYGPAVLIESEESEDEDGPPAKPIVKDLSEDFLAATLGELGTPEAPTVYVETEDRFYTYNPAVGIFVEEREPTLLARLSATLLLCAQECEEECDTKNLKFRLRDTANLRGVTQRARGLLAVKSDYFESNLQEYIPCRNGMLRLSDHQLLPFSPTFRRRNKLMVDYVPDQTCPMFMNQLMGPALMEEDLDLLQRWCGLALLGVNLAQRMIILTGTAGGGKGTFIRVLRGIIGGENMGSLRANLLADRFELGRLMGKSLLYGADVPENFLNCKGASALKAVVGGDPQTMEFKGSNERPDLVCRFNAVVTCNSRLTVHLEGDTGAWRRRLAIVEYKNSKLETVITDLSEQILAKEGSGVLNWMIAGLEKLRADGWTLRLNENQQRMVEDLLMESEADVVFAKECLHREDGAELTVARCYEAYVAFCNERGWVAMPRKRFSTVIGDTVTRQFGMTLRHDLTDDDGKNQRGWKGLLCL